MVYLQDTIPRHAECSVVQVRASSFAVTARWVVPILKRGDRKCCRCNLQQVDDENHCLFRCQEHVLFVMRSALWEELEQEQGPACIQSLTNMQSLFALIPTLPCAKLKHMCMHFVATCYQVASKWYGNDEQWKQSAAYIRCSALVEFMRQCGNGDFLISPEHPVIDLFDSDVESEVAQSENEMSELVECESELLLCAHLGVPQYPH